MRTSFTAASPSPSEPDGTDRHGSSASMSSVPSGWRSSPSRRRRCRRGSAAARRRGGGVLREEGPAGPGRQLLHLPLRRHQLQGRPAADDRNGLLQGGNSGPAVVPGEPEKSLLIQAVRHDARTSKMPPKKQLVGRADRRPDAVDQGRRGLAGGRCRAVASASPTPKYEKLRKEHWAWQPLDRARAARRSATLPGRVDDIDRFVLARLEEKGLKPVGDADKVDPDPPGHLRPDRPAADARGDRRLRRRTRRRRLREGGGPAAGLAGLRRALGPALARRRPLRRIDRLVAQPPVSRTPGAIAITSSTRSTTTSRTTSSSASRSPATCCRPARDAERDEHADRHRLPGAGRQGRQPAVQGPVHHGQRRRTDRHGQPRRSWA